MKRIICVCMAFLLLLTGCQSSQDTVEEETTNNTASMESFDDTYYNIVKFEDSELREDFYLDYGATSDFSSIGRGLQILSSQYFFSFHLGYSATAVCNVCADLVSTSIALTESEPKSIPITYCSPIAQPFPMFFRIGYIILSHPIHIH